LSDYYFFPSSFGFFTTLAEGDEVLALVTAESEEEVTALLVSAPERRGGSDDVPSASDSAS
jgi:hypothetical protein